MANQSGIKIRGAVQLRANFGRVANKLPGAVKRFLFVEGEKVRAKAIPFTPKDEGILRNSAFVTPPKQTLKGFLVLVGFGGAARGYAAAQHDPRSAEAPEAWQKKAKLNYQEPGTGPFFLEKALTEQGPGFAKRAVKMLDKATRSAIKSSSKKLKTK